MCNICFEFVCACYLFGRLKIRFKCYHNYYPTQPNPTPIIFTLLFSFALIYGCCYYIRGCLLMPLIEKLLRMIIAKNATIASFKNFLTTIQSVLCCVAQHTLTFVFNCCKAYVLLFSPFFIFA